MIELAWDSQQVALARALTQARAERGQLATQNDVLKTMPGGWSALQLLSLKRLQDQGLWDVKPKLWLERSEIELLFATLIGNLHPDGLSVRQALAVGVNPAKFSALYVGDTPPIAAEIRRRLRHMNMGQYKELRKFIAPLVSGQQGQLRIALTTERQSLPEPVIDVNVRLSKQRNEVTKSTYANEVRWLPELISDALLWVESVSTWQPHEQLAHVWLVSKLLKDPLFASR